MAGERHGTLLLTGVGRRRSIGSAIAVGLAEDGWDLILNHWAPYDARFLLSGRGSWINGQLLYSNGGFRTG